MKHLTTKITLISSLSCCLLGIAQANDVAFTHVPYITNINCGGVISNATFTITNLEEHASIEIGPTKIHNYDYFPEELIIVQPHGTGSLTTCPFNSSGKTLLKPGHSCNINLLIEPEDCSNGRIIGDIYRELEVKVGTMQLEANAEIRLAYSTLGAADDFAILGKTVSNGVGTNGRGPEEVEGSVGHTGPLPIVGQYNVTDGILYKLATDYLNPAVVNAQNSFTSTYQMFVTSGFWNGCSPDYAFPKEISSGYSCFTNNADGIRIDHQDIYLNDEGGTGDFVFFINNNDNTCFNNPTGPSLPSCNLTFGSSVSFTYNHPDTPNRVYWIVGNGTTMLTTGAQIVGNILAGQGPIYDDSDGRSHTKVVGRLWSKSDEIKTYGGTVLIPE